jgi:predicted phage terminase large subunit-like protein
MVLQGALMAELALSLEAIDRSLAADSLAEFVRQAWPLIEPTTPRQWNWHLDAICEYLEALFGGDVRRLLINMPPRSGKSILVSILAPAWLWIRYPATRLVFASYSAALSVDLSVKRRGVIQSAWYQSRWGSRVAMAPDQNLKSEFANMASGHMIATSVDGSITGKGGSIVVCDDMINPAMAESDLERTRAIRWFDETLGSRLDDKKTGRVVVIEQRTHQADLSGHLLAQGGWEHLCLPAEFERRTTIVLPRSGREVVKHEGELLWPKREGRAELDAARVRLGEYAYTCQYLQEPVARGGNRFKREWFGTYRTMPQHFDIVITAWDTAFKESETSDYSACVTIGYLGSRGVNGERPGLYVLHAWHSRVAFSELKQKAKEFAAEWKPNVVTIEDKASGQSLLQELRLDTPLPLHPMLVAGDKLVRAAAAEPTISAGRVLLPDGAPWVAEFLSEVCAFPSASHDDYVDALVYAIVFLRASGAALSESDRQFWQAAAAKLHSQAERNRGSTLSSLGAPAASRFDGRGEDWAEWEDNVRSSRGGGRIPWRGAW